MSFVVLIILLFTILFLSYLALRESDDWPDDDHLEGPRGGMAI